MINNPQVDMRVRVVDRGGLAHSALARFVSRVGTITDITSIPPLVFVVFDDARFYISPSDLEAVALTPEEETQFQDRKQRREHAEKYL